MIRLLLATRLPVGKLCLPSLLWSSLLTGEGAKLYDDEKAWYSIIHQVHSGTYVDFTCSNVYISHNYGKKDIKEEGARIAEREAEAFSNTVPQKLLFRLLFPLLDMLVKENILEESSVFFCRLDCPLPPPPPAKTASKGHLA
jgi:hypothetical protein